MALTVRQTKREATQTLLLGGCSGNLLSLNRCFASCEKHPESDKLLVEQIDIGEEARQICSRAFARLAAWRGKGLVFFFPCEGSFHTRGSWFVKLDFF